MGNHRLFARVAAEPERHRSRCSAAESRRIGQAAAGCFFWIIVHHVVDAEWSVVVRRQLENLAMLLAVMVVFFIPIVIFRHHLYDWMNIKIGHDPVLDSKRAYLNWHFFLTRSVFYFVFFIGATLLFRRFSIRQDRDGNPACTLNMRRLAFVALPLFALSPTFGAYDWQIGRASCRERG